MKFSGILKLILLILAIALLVTCKQEQKTEGNAEWPDLKTSMKPWTRWWWMGNAVDKDNITRRLEEFAEAGIGGVEITPIYGVKGYEDTFIDHLSEEWINMLKYTADEADRMGLQVDMVNGTGWPFGGPQVENEYAAGKIYIRTFTVSKGDKLSKDLKLEDPSQTEPAEVQYIYAFEKEGKKTDLTGQLTGNKFNWTADNDCRVFIIFKGRTGQQVKRAAPGGEGNVLDHFSEEALRDYLKPYDKALEPVQSQLRAMFNDSYEVYEADYSPRFFDEFRNRRGYDFTDQLLKIHSDSSGEETQRIMCDYRETISDLLLYEFSENWVDWAHENELLTKYQAHGCPGNLLDIYATADIPECESFYGTKFDIPGVRWEESDALEAYPDLILLKFASSAAHISGKELTSSETFTWLREHFKTALSQCKPELEQIFLSGVNHVFFHGSTYYPDDYPWPGWKFYASVNFVPNNTIWQDAKYMFDYISRCQTFLQSGKSDNELLIYWPFHDVITDVHSRRKMLQLAINNKDEWLTYTDFYKTATMLIEEGYSVDFVSDNYLKIAEVENGNIQLSGLEYKALIVPDSRFLPLATMKDFNRLREANARLIFRGLPETVPGYYNYKDREKDLLHFISEVKNDLSITNDVSEMLQSSGIYGEKLKDSGIDFIRRTIGNSKVYYLVNHTANPVKDYVALNCQAESVLIMDPLHGRTGLGEIRSNGKSTEVYIRLDPGKSLILRTFQEEKDISAWKYFEEVSGPVNLDGEWKLEFLSGGPEIPESKKLNELISWTELGDNAKAFSGTARYSLEFQNPDPEVKFWQINLGDVRESARVTINGKSIGCFWSVPFSGYAGKLKKGFNKIEIEVTNLSANRLRDLEIKGEGWKNFYEINMVNRHYTPFDATEWEPVPSGLIGEISLQPIIIKTF